MEEKTKTKTKNNIGAILIVTTLISLICGALGAFAIIQYMPKSKGTESIIRNVTESTLTENSIADSVEKVYDAVVVVKTYTNDKLSSTGTGFIYKIENKKTYIMTNNHVIGSGNTVKILFTDGKEEDATIVGGETYSDIAVLTVPAKANAKTAVLGKTEDLRVGDSVFTVGSPEGAEYAGTVTKGILSGKDRLVAVSYNSQINDYYMKVLQTDAAINPGNSGGPICNINGEVIGITNMKLVDSSVEGMGFAIPIEDALYYAAILETEGKVARPYIGIGMLDVTSDSYTLWQSGITIPEGVTKGVIIYAVEKDSPAEKAGLKKGDIITYLEKEEIDSLAEFRYELYKHSVGETIQVKYIRNGKESTAKITLVENSN